MTPWFELTWAAAFAAALTFVPGAVFARLVRTPPALSAAVGPSLSAGIFGLGAVIAQKSGVPWGLTAAGLTWAASLALAGLCLFVASHLPQRTSIIRASTEPVPSGENIPLVPHRLRPTALFTMVGAAALSIVPILAAMPGADAILQRWDALFHLSALARIRDTADGSTFTLGALSYSDDRTGIYPAAFHDLASLVPVESVPITLNGSVLTMATLPWAYGMMVLARELWPRLSWAPIAAGTLALLAPAAPLNEWVHLSPVPNLVGFAFLPGVGAFVIHEWRAVRAGHYPIARVLSSGLIVAGAVGGLALLHPNVLVSLSVVCTAALGIDAVALVRKRFIRRTALIVPCVAALPAVAIFLLPGSTMTGNYVGGLAVPGWQALGEVGFGLLTVWPMALGVGMWLLAWVGAWALARRGTWPLLASAAIVGALYLDAAVDSVLNLSALWYRGQDRLAMLFTLVAIPLMIAGIAHLHRVWSVKRRPGAAFVALALAAGLIVASIPTRLDNAKLNFDLDMPLRNRYFDAEEWAMLKAVGPKLDKNKKVLASPFSGGSHLFALSGQPVVYEVAGQQYPSNNADIISAPIRAHDDPQACALLREHNIGYVYVDAWYYNYSSGFDPLLTARLDLGEPLAETDHSALYRIDC